MQDIEEMIAVCDELLDLDSSAPPEYWPLSSLSDAVVIFARFRRRLSDQSIESLRRASMRWPESNALSFIFAISLVYRFVETLSADDYNEAMAKLNGIIVSSRREDHAVWWSGLSSRVYTMTLLLRSILHNNPEYTEETMSYLQSLLCSPLPDEERQDIIDAMEHLSELCLELFRRCRSSTSRGSFP